MEENKIKLTLADEVEEVAEEKEEEVKVTSTDLQENSLSEEERQMVEEFAEKIDITNANVVLQYGSEAQKKISGFSETALNNVRTKDLGEVGDQITNLVGELKGFDAEEESKGFFGMLKKQANKIANLKVKYDKAEVNVNRIVNILEDHQMTLFKDIAVLDQLYERNLTNYKELTMYILAGKKKLEKVQNEELPALIEKAKQTGAAEDAQAANDLANLCTRFEKKLHDLELTRTISMQMAPQIRLVQNNDTLMAEKIQSTIVNTIPLWKSQMVLALGINHSKQAMEAQREVTNVTNELLKKNADMLKMATVDVAKESERGIVDIETLKHTNEQLISTLDEVLRIQEEGRTKRAEASKELAKIETELKEKLIQIRS